MSSTGIRTPSGAARQEARSHTMVVLSCCLAAGIPLAAQGADPQPPPAERPPMTKPATSSAPVSRRHHLGPGDTVQITVPSDPELSVTVRLYADGSFDFPRLGTVQAAGLTTDELKEHLIRELKKQELRRPVVTVSLLEAYVPPPVDPKQETITITVLGSVTRKGTLELGQPKPLRTVLAEVGPTENADLARIRIRYPDGTARNADFSRFTVTGEAEGDVVLRGHEEVIVLERVAAPKETPRTVRVAGQVVTPGSYDMKDGMTLEDLIIAAGRLTPLADVERVELRRSGSTPRQINMLHQQKLGLEGLVRLEPGDEIFIPDQKDTVILLGVVPEPGPQALRPGQTVKEFFTTGKGAAAANPAAANLKQVQLIRKQQTRNVNLVALLKQGKREEDVVLETGDILYLPPKAEPSRGSGALDALRSLSPLGFLFSLF